MRPLHAAAIAAASGGRAAETVPLVHHVVERMLVGDAVTNDDRALATMAAVLVTTVLNVPDERAKDAFEPLVALRGGTLTALYVHLTAACAVAIAAALSEMVVTARANGETPQAAAFCERWRPSAWAATSSRCSAAETSRWQTRWRARAMR